MGSLRNIGLGVGELGRFRDREPVPADRFRSSGEPVPRFRWVPTGSAVPRFRVQKVACPTFRRFR